ncbi:unnamed protein product [Dicrocoelium dendriticum]|nr:unnamed protein product [Dicrocoelium dendriticum]
MEHLLPLLEMGYSFDEIAYAHSSGCRSVEEALEFLIGDARSFTSIDQPGKLVLGARHARPSGSLFSSTQPFHVDLPRPNQLGCTGSWEAATMNSPSTNSREQRESVIHSKHKRHEDEFIYHQTEAHKLGNQLKRERLSQREEKARLLAEIKGDKEARRLRQFTPSSPDPHGASADLVQTQPGHLDPPRIGQIRIKVIPNSNKTAPIILRLPDSAVFRDLLVAIQQHVLHVTPLARPPFADSLSTDVAGRLEEHLRTIQVTDSCIQLIAYTWPRRTLPHCSSMTQTDHDQTVLSLPLADLGLADGASVGVRHANCPFEPRSSTHDADDLVRPAVERTPTEVSISSSGESSLNPADPGAESPNDVSMERRFPPNGHQLVPRAPGSVIPRNTLSVRENVRRSALQLQHELLLLQAAHPVASLPSVSSLKPQRRWTGVTPLVILCQSRVLKLIVRYLESYAAARAGSVPDSYTNDGTAVLDCWFVNTLGTIWWPSYLGRELVMGLRERMQFNVHAATILRNCTTSLDLSYYSLVTNDMVFCLTSRWHHLTELNLNGIREGQVSVDAVAEIHRLQNLRFLSLDGLRAVCDENICGILSLPHLRCLRIASTRVTDAGWIEARQRLNQTGCSCLPLRELNASGLGSSLTNSGLSAIVSLFPLLMRLHLRSAHITEDIEPGIPPLEHLTYLDITCCQHLRCLPHVLIPPCSASFDHSGLTEIRLEHCSLLDLLTVVDQLKGHPIRCLRGLETLDSLNAYSLEAYAAAGFPLIELGLRPINFDWMVQSPRLLAQILLSVDPSHLLWLYLPQRPIERETGDDSLAVALQLLKRFENLKSLDMGDQVRQELEVNAVKEVLTHLLELRSIVFVGLPEQFEESLASACPPQCSMQVQYFM